VVVGGSVTTAGGSVDGTVDAVVGGASVASGAVVGADVPRFRSPASAWVVHPTSAAAARQQAT